MIGELIIKDPYGLYRRTRMFRKNRFVCVKHLNKYKKTYNNNELDNVINGKEVKHWILLGLSDKQDGDIFIPVFKKPRQRFSILGFLFGY